MTDIEKQATELLHLLENSKSILITSHTSPDPDAVCSLLLLGTTLKENFPDKEIKMSLEEMPDDLEYLSGYNVIINQSTDEILASFEPDLFILVDGVNFDRTSRSGGQKIRNWLAANPDTKTAIIDHHETADKDQVDVFINQGSPATTLDLYEICFRYLNLKKPAGYVDTALLGIYADTGGFAYLNNQHRKTFDTVAELLDAGGSIEAIRYKINSYSENQMKVFGELALNTTHANGYTFSYLTDSFVQKWSTQNKSIPELHKATKVFLDGYIRNIDGREWGFIVYLDLLEEGRVYSVSLRSAGGKVDVAQIARNLNGGGHKAAAGGRFEAENIEDAIKKVKQTIQEVKA